MFTVSMDIMQLEDIPFGGLNQVPVIVKYNRKDAPPYGSDTSAIKNAEMMANLFDTACRKD
jgi:hypothetical protein